MQQNINNQTYSSMLEHETSSFDEGLFTYNTAPVMALFLYQELSYHTVVTPIKGQHSSMPHQSVQLIMHQQQKTHKLIEKIKCTFMYARQHIIWHLEYF